MELPTYNNLACRQTQLNMSLYIENDSYLTDEELKAFEAHLEICSECAREYEESRFIISLVKRHWTLSGDTPALIEMANQRTKHRMTVKEGWKDLCSRCPELAESTKKSKTHKHLPHIGAVAACLVIGILTWIAFSNYSRPHAFQNPPPPPPPSRLHLYLNIF